MEKLKTITVLLILCLGGCYVEAMAAGERVFVDEQTGLMWQGQDNGSDISWPAAKDYCQDLNYAGFSDWRMPTQEELATLYRLQAADSGDYYIVSKVTLSACCQWATDTKKAKVASFDFEYGNRDWGYPMSTVDARVMAVRKNEK